MFDLIELHGADRARVRNKRSWVCGHGDPASLENLGKEEKDYYRCLDAVG
jgi:hypothetical protein